MNRLETNFNRGFSLKSDDLRFVDASIRLALGDIAKAICGDTPKILHGCAKRYEVQGSEIIEDGAIFFQNEVWHVYEHVVLGLEQGFYGFWNFIEEYDAAGVKLDADLASHQTYVVRKAVLSENPIVGSIATIPEAEVPILV